MLHFERRLRRGRGLLISLLAGSSLAVQSGCEPIDGFAKLEPGVPVYGLQAEGTDDPRVKDQYIVILPKDRPSADRTNVERRVTGLGGTLLYSYDYPTLQGFVANMPPDVLGKVRYFSDIAWIEANRVGQRTGLQTCPPANLDVIDQHPSDGTNVFPDELLDDAYAYGKTGAGVRVIVVDTGLDKQSLGDFKSSEDGATLFPSMCDSDDATHGHGTQMAQVIAGKTLGVAKEATIIGYNVPNRACGYDPNTKACKAGCGKFANGCDPECFGAAGCNSTCVMDAKACNEYAAPDIGRDIDALLDIAAAPGTLERVVIAFPHVFDGPSPTLENAVKAVLDESAIFVTSAGNDGKNPCALSPAAMSLTDERVITVGSLKWEPPVQLENQGSCVDVFAPGLKVRSKTPESTCTTAKENEDVNGSSFAAAHVAGIVALMLEEDPTTSDFKKNRFILNATRQLNLDSGTVPILHNPYNQGESGKIDTNTFDADGNEDKIRCTDSGCLVCDVPDPMNNPYATVNPCNPEDSTCLGRMRCTETECAPCGRDGARCCTTNPSCDSNLQCVGDVCHACGGQGDACCSGQNKCNSNLQCSPDGVCEGCVATCCDGTNVSAGDLADGACIREAGNGCWNHGGPMQIRAPGMPTWEPTQCPSLYPSEAVCCDGTRIDLPLQFDEKVAKQVAIEECNKGLKSKMRETYMDGQLVGYLYPDVCGKCEVLCCDNTFIGGDYSWLGISDENACKLFGGLSCEKHGYGPQWIRYGLEYNPGPPAAYTHGQYIYSKAYGECPTLHPCIATCKDLKTIFVNDMIDEAMCKLFADKDACAVHGGVLAVDFQDGLGTCSARCDGGQLIQEHGLSSSDECIQWAGSQCQARQFGVVRRVRYKYELVYDYDANQPGNCGANNKYCCDTKDDVDQDVFVDDCINRALDFRCVAFAAPPNAVGVATCSQCGGKNQPCCANDVCGKSYTCKNVGGTKTCQSP